MLIQTIVADGSAHCVRCSARSTLSSRRTACRPADCATSTTRWHSTPPSNSALPASSTRGRSYRTACGSSGRCAAARDQIRNLPYWWAGLDYPLPVVHVTQGTVANANLGQLLVPALRALAGEDVLVVAATGGRPLAALTAALGGPLPANARVAEFLPYGDPLRGPQ